LKEQDSSLDYRSAGVDIVAGSDLVERIKPIARKTFSPGVLEGLGGFASLFELPMSRFRQPVLVAGTDGVGTKLKLAITAGRHEGVGVDLVAMCVNDVVVQGAEPLFFLDYYATGKLDVDVASAVIAGIGRGCELAGCALVGGETAEMPGMYAPGDYDLAGFCVGIVEKAAIVDGRRVRPGDRLIGLASSGPHANGYSLIRKILERAALGLETEVEGKSLADWLLAPTRIYVQPLLELMKSVEVRALAHITGGGITENLPRVLPPGAMAQVRKNAWERPAIFRWLQEQGRVEEAEMLRTFNCGVGMIVCVAAEDEGRVLDFLQGAGERAFPIGEIVAGEPAVRYV
jgi:phosphoribosylformylglycinamidine cyclo-ligase